MGPNALPVPEIGRGVMDNELRLELGGQAHFGGDNTQNIYAQLNYVLAKDVVALKLYWYPLEHFNVDDATRDERRLGPAYYEAEGLAKGDAYFGAEIQLVKDKKFPDLLMRAFTKSATGSEANGARYTDSPGYFFDLSFGKTLMLNQEKEISVRPYGMFGFYSWQTYDDTHPQNDAPLYGIGADLDTKALRLSTSLGGYSGWKNNGDKPLVYRAEILKKNKKFDFLLQYQYGIQDFPYQSIKFSVQYHIVQTWIH